jgi:hypothetical protein
VKRRLVLEPVARFFFRPHGDTWVTALRTGLGLQLALYTLLLQSSWSSFLSTSGSGFITREFGEAMIRSESRFIPHAGWAVTAGEWLGLSEEACLFILWIALLTFACCLVAGVFCRTAAVGAWFLHLAVAKSAGLFSYGVDNLMTIGLFYLMLSPLPDRQSLDSRWRQIPPPNPQLLGLFRRVLQLHLCIIYFFGGLAKALGAGWWDGSNLWRALTRPPFDILSPETVASLGALLPMMGISVWLIEILYPILIWPRRTRLVWLLLTCTLHLSIALGMGMYLFALVMIVLNVAAFGTPLVATRAETGRG